MRKNKDTIEVLKKNIIEDVEKDNLRKMYLKRSYKEKKTRRIPSGNGDILIYDEMEKRENCITGEMAMAEWGFVLWRICVVEK